MNKIKKRCRCYNALILLLILGLLSLLPVVFAQTISDANNQTEEISEGLFYSIKSSIFKWFQKTKESIKSVFVDNVEIYENESTIYSEYYRQRNEKIENSYLNSSEPPFNSSICAQSYPITKDTRFTFCSCGDGICASYEDKCNCPRDCGSCQQGTVCKRGECVEFVANTCMNTICEQGENETCPWDCNVYMQEEQKENLTAEEKLQISERIRTNREEFLRSHGMSEEDIIKTLITAENESEQAIITLPEEPED